MTDVSFGKINYNAALGAYEARVDIRRGGRTFRYPAQLAGPLDMSPDQVRAGLARKAASMSDSDPELFSHI